MISAPEMFKLITGCKWPNETMARSAANENMWLGFLIAYAAWIHSKIALSVLLFLLIMQWVCQVVDNRRFEKRRESSQARKAAGLEQ